MSTSRFEGRDRRVVSFLILDILIGILANLVSLLNTAYTSSIISNRGVREDSIRAY